MIPDRDYFLAKAEVDQRRKVADEDRAARQARLEVERRRAEQGPDGEEPHGAFGWLRRLVGAR